MKVYDYKCSSCGEIHEHFVANSDVLTVACPSCNGVAERQLAAPRFTLPGYDPAFPTAWDRWEKNQMHRVRTAEKQNSESE